MQDREISSEGSEFLPGTKLAESLVEIPTLKVRFPYPKVENFNFLSSDLKQLLSSSVCLLGLEMGVNIVCTL